MLDVIEWSVEFTPNNLSYFRSAYLAVYFLAINLSYDVCLKKVIIDNQAISLSWDDLNLSNPCETIFHFT